MPAPMQDGDFEPKACAICKSGGEQLCAESLCWQCCMNNDCDCCSEMLKHTSIHHHSPAAYKHRETESADNTSTSHTALHQNEIECCAICEAEDNDGELCAKKLCWKCCLNNNCNCFNKEAEQDLADIDAMFEVSPLQLRFQQATVARYIHSCNYVCMDTAWNLWRGYNTVVHGKFSTPQKGSCQQDEVKQAQNSFEILSVSGDTSGSEISEESDPSDQEAFDNRQHGKGHVEPTAVRRNPARQRQKPTEIYVPSPSGMEQTTHEYEAALESDVSDVSIRTGDSHDSLPGLVSPNHSSSESSDKSDMPPLDMDACVECNATLEEAITLCNHSMCDNCCPAVNCPLSPMAQFRTAEWIQEDVKNAYHTVHIDQGEHQPATKTHIAHLEKIKLLSARNEICMMIGADLVLMFDMGGRILENIMDQLHSSILKTAKKSFLGLRLTPLVISTFTDNLADTLWTQQQVDIMSTCKALQVSMHQNNLIDMPPRTVPDTFVWGPPQNNSQTDALSSLRTWDSKHFPDVSYIQHFR
jgi:hypothetical protein